MFNVPLFFFDLETTGIDTDTCGIVQMAYKRIGTEDESGNRWEDSATLVMNPLTHIEDGASRVHGFTDEMVAELASFEVYADTLYGLSDGAYWVGYNNVKFDVPIFKNHFKKFGLKAPKPAGMIDCYKIFTHYYGMGRGKGERNLQSAHIHYCGVPFDGAHDAMADITATYEVLADQIDEHQDTLTLEKAVQISSVRDLKIDHRGFFKFSTTSHTPICAVGKFAGKALCDVPAEYLGWVASNESFGDDTREVAKNALIGVFPVWKG